MLNKIHTLLSRRKTSHAILHRCVMETCEARQMFCYLHGSLMTDVPLVNSSASINGVQGTASFGSTSPASTLITTPIALAASLPGMPVLHSLPGAPTAIYLDWDGDGTNTPYDLDGDATTFNAAEQANITSTWREVATYYAMFNVDVTTEQPASSIETAWVVIGNNAGNGGGYAYVNTFPNSTPQGFVNSNNVPGRASGIVHEAGHIFGLWHQSDYDTLGNKTNEYSSGYTLHGPIMGVDYSQNIHKWYIGHGSTAYNTLQDDITTISGRIASYSGNDGFRPDDYGNTSATASALTFTNGSATASGVIERMSDADVFSFTSTGGAFSIAVNANYQSGLDSKVEIYDASNNLIAASDNASNNQSLSPTLASGTYYIYVKSHGLYGDLGQYGLTVRTLPAPWQTTDIGVQNYSPAGSAGFDSTTSTYTVSGSGADIAGTSDGFRFAYQILSGDGSIIARVTSIPNTNNAAKAGVMIRQSLATGSTFVSSMLNAGGGYGTDSRYRSVTNNNYTYAGGTSNVSAPYWVRVIRTGNSFSTSYSSDGTTWTAGITTSITMTGNVYIGLAVTGVNNYSTSDATFDNVSLTGTLNPTTASNGQAAPTGLTANPVAGSTTLTLAWSDVAGNTGYAIEQSIDGVNFTQIATVATSILTYTDSTPTGGRRYFYRLRTLNASGSSDPSAVVSAVDCPSAPAMLATTTATTTSIVLNWRNTDGNTGYIIQRSTDNVNFTQIAIVTTNRVAYENTGLTTNTTYYYRVIASSAAGNSPIATATPTTLLPAVTGVSVSASTTTTQTVQWAQTTGATGYYLYRSTDNTTFSQIATLVGGATLSYLVTGLNALTPYYYYVKAYNTLTTGLISSTVFASTAASTPVPSSWVQQDIGSVKGAGQTGYVSVTGTYTMVSSGSDFAGTADSGRFSYVVLTGDASIVAQVSSFGATASATAEKAGVMIRQDLTAGSKFVSSMLNSGGGYGTDTRSRTTLNGNYLYTAGTANVVAPYWVRIVRTGNSFATSYSADGTTWTTGATITVTMTGNIYVGLAMTAFSTTLMGTATFTNVLINGSTLPTIATPAAASSGTITTATTNLSVLGADDNGESALNYTWATTGSPPAAVTFSINGTNAAKNTVATFTKAGTYSFVVTVLDANSLTTTSTLTVTVVNTTTTIAISPANPTMISGQSTQFTAIARDQFGVAMSQQPTLFWTITSGGGSLDASTGSYVADSSSPTATIECTDFTVIGSTTITIASAAPQITSATATPSSVTGKTTALAVVATDDSGEANLIYTWAVTSMPAGVTMPTFSANGSNAAKNAVARFYKVGSYTFSVTARDQSGLTALTSVNITVSQALTSIIVSPNNFKVTVGTQQQFNAAGYDQFGNRMTVTPTFAWSATLGTVNSSGLYTAPATANLVDTITATSGGKTGSATISTRAAGIPLAPGSLTVKKYTGNMLGLTWRDNSTDETSFEIQYGAGTSSSTVNWATSITTSPKLGAVSTITYNFASPFTAGQTYYFRVRAVNTSGSSSWSVVVAVVM